MFLNLLIHMSLFACGFFTILFALLAVIDALCNDYPDHPGFWLLVILGTLAILISGLVTIGVSFQP